MKIELDQNVYLEINDGIIEINLKPSFIAYGISYFLLLVVPFMTFYLTKIESNDISYWIPIISILLGVISLLKKEIIIIDSNKFTFNYLLILWKFEIYKIKHRKFYANLYLNRHIDEGESFALEYKTSNGFKTITFFPNEITANQLEKQVNYNLKRQFIINQIRQ